MIIVLLLGACKQIANSKFIGSSEVVFLIIGIIFGSGGLWSFFRTRYQKKSYRLEETKLASELSSDVSEKLIVLMQKSERYTDVRDGKVTVDILPNELKKLDLQIELLKGDITVLEKRLAQIEGREPRDISLNFIHPAPPKNIRVEDVCGIGDVH